MTLLPFPSSALIQLPLHYKEASLLKQMHLFMDTLPLSSRYPISFLRTGHKNTPYNLSYLSSYPPETLIVRLTGDNPLIPPDLIVSVIKNALSYTPSEAVVTRSDFLPPFPHQLPPGLDIEVIPLHFLAVSYYSLLILYKYVAPTYYYHLHSFSPSTSFTIDTKQDLRRLDYFCRTHSLTPSTPLTLTQLQELTNAPSPAITLLNQTLKEHPPNEHTTTTAQLSLPERLD